MFRITVLLCSLCILISCTSSKVSVLSSPSLISHNAESGYWQQHVDYKMAIDVDVNSYTYKGKQELVYTNNSPDTLNKVFYHLYFNAFQPGSEMDVRSQTISDPDSRVGSRIGKLKPSEIGYIKVNSLTQDDVKLEHNTVGTVLEVMLEKPILPGETTTFKMDFDAQVPEQIRRSGRNNKEGVALSMTQWYPKMAEYDFEGWHADPYIGREFHGVWGNFDVKITIDKTYTIGGTGYLQNANEIGHGYTKVTVNHTSDKLTWHFKAPNVHDFSWAADPAYIHETKQVPNGPLLHFFYKNNLNDDVTENWKKMQSKAVDLITYFSEHIGAYPYEQYSVIQGGDGGMEYAMCTLITANRSFESLVGVTAHEMAHTWFQFLLATNEAKHEWMDEGFTTYISNWAMHDLFKKIDDPLKNAYNNYIYLANSGKEQPLTTHADRYAHNQSYGISAYSKGAVFLSQLGYVIGDDYLKKTIKQYFKSYAFKHPKPLDVIRVAEKISGLELDWYLTDFTQTTNTIDYAVASIDGNVIKLERRGLMPMPIDFTVTYMDGSKTDFYIPLQMMRGEKPTSSSIIRDWAWAYPTYTLETPKPIKSVEIDPKKLMADIDRGNNIMQVDN